MKNRVQRLLSIAAVLLFLFILIGSFVFRSGFQKHVLAQTVSPDAVPAPTPDFDQEKALAALREQIKGKEQMPAGEVFKNIQNLREMPAGRILAIMNFGYSRSLGVNCTHCHTPEKWESDEKPAKQIAREMHKMAETINFELLKNMKSLGGRTAVVNCTTCHRGEVKPATNLPR
ncbi:MAG: c-type cytochrome [Acidobacteria bacterium]|nr:c-type cytochrome [Acidobacteriota bacterium]